MKIYPDINHLSPKAQLIIRVLAEKYPHIEIPLLYQDAFSLLIAIILSAQCTDKRVNLVTPKLFSAAKTPFEMSQLPVEQIERIIHSCGFFRQKAKSISGTAAIISEKYNGEVPKNMHQLEALPGVGHKTASVLMAQYFHQPAFPVDTHVRRLSNRWGISHTMNVTHIEQDLKQLFPDHYWADISLRMVQFGRDFCPARGHIAKNCPICSKIERLSTLIKN